MLKISKKSLLIQIIIALVAVIGIFAVVYFTKPAKVEAPIVTPVVDTSDWKTYSMPKYGFEVKYPDKLNTEYAILEINTPSPIIISNTDDKLIKQGCYLSDLPDRIATSTVKINDNIFCLTKGVGVGAGQLYDSYYYTILHEDRYITLNYSIHTSNGCGAYSEPQKTECDNFKKSYDLIVMKSIKDSVGTFKFIETSEPELPKPVITSISPSSGPVGTVIEIRGSNLSGFEGDLDAMIENANNEIAFLQGLDNINAHYFNLDSQIIRVKIEDRICKKGNTYSGLPCESYLTITPGVYNIYAYPWGKMSNKVKFTVTETKSEEQVACTMDAMICPDGSYVGRSGPKCKFVCPVKQNNLISGNVAKFSQTVEIRKIKITPLELIEYSLCPTGTICVWAGTVKLKVKIESEGKSYEVVLNLNENYKFNDGQYVVLLDAPHSSVADEGFLFKFDAGIVSSTTN